ncbi:MULTISPECIES: GntR family transcriptional regulator [unclassified Roseitalea]|uniref:GntR family transcriptional regulator n=1 Tax=unclassified Roseitalea TaxID=2639107 RepID=UPI00273E183F|nr:MULTISPECIES: GntR family transcriptional regulator [unclassified Roseitalea]
MSLEPPRPDDPAAGRPAPLTIIEQIVAGLPAPGVSANPLYLQLAGAIRALIETGALKDSEALPSERDLAAATGLSRVTVRGAIDTLCEEGLMARRRGARSYVTAQIDQPLSLLVGFTDDMKRRGATASSRVIEKTVSLPSPEESLKLALSPTDRVVRLTRIRMANGEPLALERAVVPLEAVRPEQIGASLYKALHENGFAPHRALQRLQAATASAREAELLEIDPGSPIQQIERLSYLANGQPIEMTRSAYRGDRFDFLAELRVEVPGGA